MYDEIKIHDLANIIKETSKERGKENIFNKRLYTRPRKIQFTFLVYLRYSNIKSYSKTAESQNPFKDIEIFNRLKLPPTHPFAYDASEGSTKTQNLRL